MIVNKLYNENCLYTMERMPEDYVDLTITSPPYDNMRKYSSKSYFNFEEIAIQLYRVTKYGGVVVWIVNDWKRNGSKSLTTFKQGLYFKEVGFNMHDVMIWHKPNNMPNVIKNYYPTAFEYMFILSKGTPLTTNIIQVPCKHAGEILCNTKTKTSVYYRPHEQKPTKATKPKQNVWTISVGGRTNYGHPATFPEQLVHDHMITWSNVGDLVYDPMAGVGTTLVVAKKLRRFYIGSEIVNKYCKSAIKRIEEVK